MQVQTLLLLATFFALCSVQQKSSPTWPPVVTTEHACDTLDAFRENDSTGFYVLKCDSTIIRCIYESSGHYDLAYKRLNERTYLEYCFHKNGLSQKDSFDLEGALVYHEVYVEGKIVKVVYGKNFNRPKDESKKD